MYLHPAIVDLPLSFEKHMPYAVTAGIKCSDFFLVQKPLNYFKYCPHNKC
jgi:hypothetical protein